MKKINILSESELRRLVKKTINEKLLYEQAQTQPQDYTIQQLQNLLNQKGYNVGTVDGSYRLSIRPNGAGQEDKHYIAYNTPVPANDSVALTLGVTMDAADVLTVFASNASLSFNVFGTELS